MIRLTRPPRPTELTVELQQEATAEFKATKKSVWNRTFLRSALRAMAYGKCAFCECKLGEESKYLEVEHFAHKDGYPDLVMEWTNLLPACRRCNGQKLTHDVVTSPIINPADDDPRASLGLRLYRFVGLDEKGRTTIDVLELNDYDRLMLSRFRVGDAVLQQLDEVACQLRSFDPNQADLRTKNRIFRQLRNLMREAQPNAEYSATVATAITQAQDYAFAKSELERHQLWTKEFTELDFGMRAIAYRN
ncbi:MAG: HNH endonuclease [Verrucomicrobiota bacterium]